MERDFQVEMLHLGAKMAVSGQYSRPEIYWRTFGETLFRAATTDADSRRELLDRRAAEEQRRKAAAVRGEAAATPAPLANVAYKTAGDGAVGVVWAAEEREAAQQEPPEVPPPSSSRQFRAVARNIARS